MNIKYIMQKSRYKFSYDDKTPLYDASILQSYKKEISLLQKELYIYNISFKNLAKSNPRPIIKDELLNIAIICTENEKLSNWIKIRHTLPYKELCAISGKPQKFFERWSEYIITLFIIFNNNYSNLSSFLNIKTMDAFVNEKSESKEIMNINNGEDKLIGIVLKSLSKCCYILTSTGDFALISVDDEYSIGELCSGKIKKQRDYYNAPGKLFIFITVLALFFAISIYFKEDQIIIIDSSSLSMNIEINKLNRVIKVTAMNQRSNTLKKEASTFNKNIDSALASILETAVSRSYLDKSESINIYISGDHHSSINLSKSQKYIKDNELSVTINYNGRTLSSE
ncbi:MAG: hypothetical protein GX895_05725 [Clostridiales bacterium]|uniref:anti-sigma-I factor RsgI family protein n=1 Tax=Clostridium sp. N3C TaxID=1776758 RepID=UPI00092E096D|nr:hypothetical protein [Clostridium sp. N3C]NLZ48281.1 hypothetical protein [Clostridiales bacterium]SCN22926.1 RNA polymerase sigma factor SigI [Clostridium sp. N3C]